MVAYDATKDDKVDALKKRNEAIEMRLKERD